MNIESILVNISIWALPVLLAIVLHEVAHGKVADMLGDDTARWMGRLTLNPISHIDPIGTVLIPLVLLVMGSPFLFGYAKPVPVNFNKLRNPKRDMILVALAGPLTNLALAIASALLLWVAFHMPESMRWFAEPLAMMCQASILINVVLFVFNLLPIPPLDGGRVAVGLLPKHLAYQLERIEPYGFFIIIGLLVMGVFQTVLGPIIYGISKALVTLAL
ncbi:MAG: site-2 protease family protein [Zetaproteobacteria bacterium]|nr:MAG: site-2 protease family protein [Zetaproteobacteria bacterium]